MQGSLTGSAGDVYTRSMAGFETSEQVLGGIRKLVQDLVAPEVSGLKATLTAIVDGQKLMREDMRALEARLSADIRAAREEIKTSEARLVERIDSSEARMIERVQASEIGLVKRIETSEAKLIDRIEQSKHEIVLAVENRFLREKNEQLKKRLELPTQ